MIAEAAALVASTVLAAGAAAPERANVWVSPQGGSCHRDAKAATFTAASACPDLDSAYGAARNGDLVLFRGGRYLDGDPLLAEHNGAVGTGKKPVVMRPAAGAKVVIDMQGNSGDFKGVQALTIDGRNRWTFYRGSPGVIPANGSGCGAPSNGLTLENLTINGALSTRNAQHLTVRNVTIGDFSYPAAGQDAWGDSSRIGDYDCGPAMIASHVTFDHVHWHDIYRGSSPSHAECLFVEAAHFVTIENSRLDACPIIGIFLKNDSQAGPTNYQNSVVIQNNVISRPCPKGPRAGGDECGWFGIQEADCDNDAGNPPPSPALSWTIRFNSLVGGTQIWLCESGSRWATTSRLYGNVADRLVAGSGGSQTCGNATKAPALSSWSIGWNVWARDSCASTDRLSTSARAAKGLVPASAGCLVKPTRGACDAGAKIR